MRRTTLFVIGAYALVVAPWAGAHAEIGPENVPANSVSKFVLRVEGEEDSATVKIAMQLPRGVTNAKPEPAPGWQAKRAGRVITWTGGRLPQGQSVKFEVTAHFPNSPGRTLTFPTVQTYADGTVVRWIGAPSSDTPAPTISLTTAQQPPPPPPVTTTTTTTTSQNDDDDGGSTGWIIGAVVVAVLVGSGIALLRRRRR
jgi:uncharacterized protein YcnI